MRHKAAPIVVGLCLMALTGAIPLSKALAVPLIAPRPCLPGTGRPDSGRLVAVATTALSAPGDPEHGKSDFMGGDDSGDEPAPIPFTDMPVERSVELTLGGARRALDAYAAVRERYIADDLDHYPTLEAFAASSPAGRRFAGDIKSFGFSGVGEWNRIIVSIGYALDAVVDNSERDIDAQIARAERNNNLSPGKRARMIANLKAQLPSESNKIIVRQLILDPLYRDKLALLAVYE